MLNTINQRKPEAEVDPQFLDRWSPRAYSEQPLARETLLSLFEAARWAPSASNEQPWLFVYADEGETRDRFRSLLNPSNQVWANKAPVLLYVLSRLKWSKSGRDYFTHQFDAGMAFMSLALQARKLGLFAHPMGGFDREKAYDVLKVPKQEWVIIVAVAIGYYGDPQLLPPDLQEREKPSLRKPLHDIYHLGPLHE
jgi:nitroreductase